MALAVAETEQSNYSCEPCAGRWQSRWFEFPCMRLPTSKPCSRQPEAIHENRAARAVQNQGSAQPDSVPHFLRTPVGRSPAPPPSPFGLDCLDTPRSVGSGSVGFHTSGALNANTSCAHQTCRKECSSSQPDRRHMRSARRRLHREQTTDWKYGGIQVSAARLESHQKYFVVVKQPCSLSGVTCYLEPIGLSVGALRSSCPCLSGRTAFPR